MGELTATVLRFAFLALLWVLIFSVLVAMRRDLAVGRKARTTASSRGAAAGSEAPAAPPRPQVRRLVVVEGPQEGTVIDLSGPVMMGRAQESTLVLEDDYASGRHARLFPQGSRWFLEDLGSTNGTFVNDQQLTRAVPIEPGTPIRIGKTVIELRP
ncbi:FHA domain-containing protein FhaB [Tersicoccus solisilvae]|uniref:FHA domain-containing protein FhaB n=1 Tax=Tersicoccus solisilvae TaxID=1882339 RepID=A0ABQ1NM49_9MICC|nr:FHA domain-containing protein [Tersicoccus solisilvae]GGC78596.1 FHA domain-containing protein FhaB [Tersicoccus solisilvae]